MTIVGVAVVASMVYRNDYPVLGVLVALVCLGVITTSAATSWLLGRVNGKE